jgi:glycosyltransferase 2 family protein
LAVGLGLSALSLWMLFLTVDERASLRILRDADPVLVAVAVTCLFLSLSAKIARWGVLLPNRPRVSFPNLFSIVQISMFLNNVLPFRMGDGVRCAMTVRKHGLRLGHVVSSMVAERVLDTVTLALCFLAVTPFLSRTPLHFDTGALALPGAAVGVVAAVAALALILSRRFAPRRWARWAPALGTLVESWRRIASTEGWPIWVWSAVAWIGAFSLNYALFHALGIEASPIVAIVVGCSTNLAMLVPSSPAQIGVYHAAATLTLVAFGVDETAAVSFSVLSHLVNVVPVSLVGASLLVSELLFRRPSRQAVEAD